MNVSNHATGQYHLVLLQSFSPTDLNPIPVLYLYHQGKLVRWESLIQYFLHHSKKSLNWKRGVARAVGLFFDYCAVSESTELFEGVSKHRNLFRQFGLALLNGTVDVHLGTDPTGLAWPPSRYEVANQRCQDMHAYIRWYARECESGRDVISRSALVPEITAMDRFVAAYQLKRISFFAHLHKTDDIAKKIATERERSIVDLGRGTHSSSGSNPVHAFPRALIDDFFSYGFSSEEQGARNFDRTAFMVSLLLFFGGARKSEPLHLWFNDVVPEFNGSGKCHVFLRHPSDAETYLIGEKGNRRAYLLERGLTPRTESQTKSYRAGWKLLDVDDSLSAPIFFLHEEIEALFYRHYKEYLKYREELMRIRRLSGLPDHPFLFVSSGTDYSTGKSFVGEPYSARAFDKAFRKAVDIAQRRNGISAPIEKRRGTTPHAPRHFYARALVDAGVSPSVIQICLRQRSVMSQGVYTTPEAAQVHKLLEAAKKKIDISSLGMVRL